MSSSGTTSQNKHVTQVSTTFDFDTPLHESVKLLNEMKNAPHTNPANWSVIERCLTLLSDPDKVNTVDMDNVVSNLQDENGEKSRRGSETSIGRGEEIQFLLAHAARHRRGSMAGVADLDVKRASLLSMCR